MARNTFSDPLGVTPNYVWPLNHHTETAAGRKRDVTATQNVAGTQLVTQQGDKQPFTLTYAGSILVRSQLVAMWQWEALCEHQTIYFTDFAGDSYEVLITDFEPIRVAARNRRGEPEGNPLWYWTYTLTMTVIAVRAGTVYDAGIVS